MIVPVSVKDSDSIRRDTVLIRGRLGWRWYWKRVNEHE